jgi:hypothetical protein
MDGHKLAFISPQDLYGAIGTAAAPVVIDVGRSAAFGIAYTWLIRRFIDPEAEYRFGPTECVFADAAAKANAGLRVVDIYPQLHNSHAVAEMILLREDFQEGAGGALLNAAGRDRPPNS